MLARLIRHLVWVVFVAMILTGGAIHFVLSRQHTPHDSEPGILLRMLADAFVVAGLLGATVDWGLKRALVRDVGSIFIGWALPLPVRNYIRDVSETAIVRTCQLHYRLTVEGQEVILDVTDSCDVFNYSTGVRRYQSITGIDRHENPDPSSVRCVVTWRGKSRVFDSATLKKEETPHSIHWKTRWFLLAPQDVNDPTLKPACQTRWQYRQRMPLTYSTIAAFGTPTLGVTITIDWPRDRLNVVCKPSDPDYSHVDGDNVWQYGRLYMPGQHIRLYWWPVDPM